MSTTGFCPKRAAVVDALAAKYGLPVKRNNATRIRTGSGPVQSFTFFQSGLRAGLSLREVRS